MPELSHHHRQLKRASSTAPADADFLMRFVVDDMMERLGAVKREFENGLALFGRTAYLAEAMRSSGQIKAVGRLEEGAWLGEPDKTVPAPDDLRLDANSLDLVLAPFSLHWADDLPGALVQIQRALTDDGLFMAVLPGPNTLRELRECLLAAESEMTGGAGNRIDLFTEIRDAGALMQRVGFALPVVDQDTTIVRYDNVHGLIQDLRHFGATNRMESRSRPLGKSMLVRLEQIYAERFSDPDGRIRASFQMVSMSGWAPHESQQKPLKPGSAKVRLADALKTKERKI